MNADQVADVSLSREQTKSEPLRRIDVPDRDDARLYGNLMRIVEQSDHRDTFLLALLKYALQQSNGVAAMYFQRDSNGELELGPRIFAQVLSQQHSELLAAIKAPVQNVVTQGAAIEVLSSFNSEYQHLLTPVAIQGQQLEVLALTVPAMADRSHRLIELQLLAGFVNLFHTHRQFRLASWEAGHSASLIEITAQTLETDSSVVAWQTLANQLAQLFACSRLAIASGDGVGRIKQIQAVSGNTEFDKRTALAKALERALKEASASGALLQWPPLEGGNTTVLPGHKALMNATHCQYMISVPLLTVSGKPRGAFIAWWDAPPALRQHAQQLMQASAMPVAALVDQLQPHKHRLRVGKAGSGKTRLGLTLLGVMTVVALLVALWMPVPHRISTTVTLEAAVLRVSAAPFDGLLLSARVRPGSLVQSGEPLAELDGQEIRLQLSRLDAEIRVAEKRRDISLVEADANTTQIARLEIQKLTLQRDLLEERLENLIIRSPVGGVVVSGDLDRTQGSPVSRGQILFEIAPLNRMLAEVAIPGEDISFIAVEQPLSIVFDGLPGEKREMRLGPVRPRAEVVKEKNVFISEVELNNDDARLRPGMQGRGKILAGRQPLGWVLFHKPWEQLSRWLGLGIEKNKPVPAND